MKFQANKTKLIARVLVLVLLVTSVLILTACPGYGYRTAKWKFSSYDEMLQYATNHKEEFESDHCVFLLFDIEKYENIETEYYIGETMWYDGWNEFLKLSQNDKITDNHEPFSITSYFTINLVLADDGVTEDVYQIKCKYMGVTSVDVAEENTSGIRNSRVNYSKENNRYVSTYSVFVQGNLAIDIDIYHKYKATQEELDVIVQIFMDNAIVIK